MEFFVPGVPAEEAEQQYSLLAERSGVPVPPPGERIQSITFRRDGVAWTAAVGQRLAGSELVRDTAGDALLTRSDPATVRAVFAGDPYMVMTDAEPSGAVVSVWDNPFAAPKHTVSAVTYFDLSKSG
jgi:hypothetical protein